MKENLKSILPGAAVAIAFFLLGVFLPRCNEQRRQGGGAETEIVTDTITYVDTVRHIAPAPTQTALVRYREIAVPRYVTAGDTLPRIRADTDSLSTAYAELNAASDSVLISIPIEQKVYKDADYTAYVSGYEPSLDSIFVYPKREIVTKTIKKPPKRWHIGPTVGYGYTPHGFQPFIGVSLSYSVISF